MNEILNIVGLFINFIGAIVMVNGTPIQVGAAIYSDGGKAMNEKYRKKVNRGKILFCIGFGLQLTSAIMSLFKPCT